MELWEGGRRGFLFQVYGRGVEKICRGEADCGVKYPFRVTLLSRKRAPWDWWLLRVLAIYFAISFPGVNI